MLELCRCPNIYGPDCILIKIKHFYIQAIENNGDYTKKVKVKYLNALLYWEFEEEDLLNLHENVTFSQFLSMLLVIKHAWFCYAEEIMQFT